VSTRAMTCRDALVFLVDGEGSDPDAYRRARAHASVCPRCASSYDDRDASRRVIERHEIDVPGPSLRLRVLLVVVATAQLVLACPWLFGASLVPDHQVTAAHLTRDGALGLLVACVALVSAWRPRYAVGALLIGLVAIVAQFASGLVDQQEQAVSGVFELTHVLSLIIVVLLACACTTVRGHGSDGRRPPTLHSL
jgi:hypothetical protein